MYLVKVILVVLGITVAATALGIWADYEGTQHRKRMENEWLNVYEVLAHSGIPIENPTWYTVHHVLTAEVFEKRGDYCMARRLVANAITVAQRYRGGSLGTYLPLSLREYVPKGLTLAHNRGGTVVMK